MSFECRSKPSRFHLMLFIQYTWIHSWLQNSLCLESRICFGWIFLVLAVKQQRWSVPRMPSWCCDTRFLNNAIDRRKLLSFQASSQQLKFTTSDSCDRIKDEFQFLQAQYHRYTHTFSAPENAVCHHLFTLIVPNLMFFFFGSVILVLFIYCYGIYLYIKLAFVFIF